MKILRYTAASVLVALFAVACNDGIDPINEVAPGEDIEAPKVTIEYPFEGAQFRSKLEVAPIDIKFKATDDIEIQSISFTLDGTKVGEVSDFVDYRRVLTPYRYATLSNGNHTLTVTASDLTGKSSSATVQFEKVPPYNPKYPGEIFYMSFDGDYFEMVNIVEATRVGAPGFSEAKVGLKSYVGAADAYLTFPTAGLLGQQFSATFWYKINATPDRSGILTISPPDPEHPTAPNIRTHGLRFFREAGGNNGQIFKLNVGNGTADVWYDDAAKTSVNPATAGWVHLAFTISRSECAIYVNGALAKKDSFTGVNWTGCDLLAIGTGAPRFLEWGHKSDLSLMDELRLYNKALTLEEVQAVMNGN